MLALVAENSVFIMAGLRMTFALALTSLFFTTLISVVLGTAATSRFRPLRVLVRVYMEIFRDTPIIVTVFFVFFGAPAFGLALSPFAAVVVALTLWASSNGIEIVRAGITSISRHQWQSAMALGLKQGEILIFVIAPQALRVIIPPFTGLSVLVVQATALGALVGVNEFFKVGQIIIERTTLMEGQSPAFTVYTLVLLIYFVICSTLTWFSRWLERRLSRSVRRTEAATQPVVKPAEAVV